MYYLRNKQYVKKVHRNMNLVSQVIKSFEARRAFQDI